MHHAALSLARLPVCSPAGPLPAIRLMELDLTEAEDQQRNCGGSACNSP